MGDIEAGLREAEVVVEGRFRTHPVHQSYLEPQSVTIAPSSSGHQLVIWSSTQGLFAVRSAVASALVMPERQIRVEPVPIGGGFGGKETLLEPLVAAVAQRLRKPVRLVLTRMDDLLAGNPAPQTMIDVTLGAKRDGTLTAIQAKVIVDSGAYPDPLVGMTGFHFFGAHRSPHVAVRCDVVQTNKPGTGSYRAPTGPQSYFALESTVQDLSDTPHGLKPGGFSVQRPSHRRDSPKALSAPLDSSRRVLVAVQDEAAGGADVGTHTEALL